MARIKARYRSLAIRWATAAVAYAHLLSPTPNCHADIYRFVTVDGVETFTDAPAHKGARLVMREAAERPRKKSGNRKKGEHPAVTLDEVVTGTTNTSGNYQRRGAQLRLPQVGGMITSGMGMRVDPIDGTYRQHNGIDIAIGEGTAVTPVANGTVIYSGQRNGYGNTVVIDHGNGLVTLYAHNSRLLVAVGERVATDTLIALSGNTGRSTGPHLHFEAWQSGENITGTVMPASGEGPQRLATSGTGSRFRSEVLADGSILFTNLPSRR